MNVHNLKEMMFTSIIASVVKTLDYLAYRWLCYKIQNQAHKAIIGREKNIVGMRSSKYFYAKIVFTLTAVLSSCTFVLEPMSCIVYSEAPGYFEINKERDIITE